MKWESDLQVREISFIAEAGHLSSSLQQPLKQKPGKIEG